MSLCSFVFYVAELEFALVNQAVSRYSKVEQISFPFCEMCPDILTCKIYPYNCGFSSSLCMSLEKINRRRFVMG